MKIFIISQVNDNSTSLMGYDIYTEEEFSKLDNRKSKTYRLRMVYSRAEVARYSLAFNNCMLKVEGELVGFGSVDLTSDSIVITFYTPIIIGYNADLNRVATIHSGNMMSCIAFPYVMQDAFEDMIV